MGIQFVATKQSATSTVSHHPRKSSMRIFVISFMLTIAFGVAAMAGTGPIPFTFCMQQSGIPEAQECTVGKPEPIIAKRKDVFVVRKGPAELVERLQLSPGIRAEIIQAGCAHYGLTMAFTLSVAKAGEEKAVTAVEAIRLLRLLKPRMKRTGPVDEAITILRRHQNELEQGQPLQDPEFEMVTLYLKSARNGVRRVVSVLYSSTL